MADATTYLQIKIEHVLPLELGDVAAALGGLSRQYELFIERRDGREFGVRTKLYVQEIRPGSVDITLINDFAATVAPVLPIISDIKLLIGFFEHFRAMIDFFSGDTKTTVPVEIADCNNVQKIVGPISQQSGNGLQVNIFQNGKVTNNFIVDAGKAGRAARGAAAHKVVLGQPIGEALENQLLMWDQTSKRDAKTKGTWSPDKAVIEAIDPKPRSVLFDENVTQIKKRMMDDPENMFQKIYIVDVLVIITEGKIRAYKVINLHGILDRNADD